MAPSAIAIDGSLMTPDGTSKPYTVPRALEESELPALINDYRQAARNALDAGFDGELTCSFCVSCASFLHMVNCLACRLSVGHRESFADGEAAVLRAFAAGDAAVEAQCAHTQSWLPPNLPCGFCHYSFAACLCTGAFASP